MRSSTEMGFVSKPERDCPAPAHARKRPTPSGSCQCCLQSVPSARLAIVPGLLPGPSTRLRPDRRRAETGPTHLQAVRQLAGPPKLRHTTFALPHPSHVEAPSRPSLPSAGLDRAPASVRRDKCWTRAQARVAVTAASVRGRWYRSIEASLRTRRPDRPPDCSDQKSLVALR